MLEQYAVFNGVNFSEILFFISGNRTLSLCFSLQLYSLAQETIVWLLDFNPDYAYLLEWVIDRCYTAQPEVADGCFLALARIFSDK